MVKQLLFAMVGAAVAHAASDDMDMDIEMNKMTEELAPKFLSATDAVGVSFWVISIAMVAATVFTLAESMHAPAHWRTSLNCGALVTLVAGVHYWYMREYWLTYQSTPIVYRYIDWLITVPLQMIEFYFILCAVGRPSVGMFWRLFLGTIVMLLAGYCGESGYIPAFIGFVVGMCGWGFILYEIFNGEGGKVAVSAETPKHAAQAFSTMRFIVTVGWSIYPLGYFFGYMNGAVSDDALNIIYNIADLVNKICFVLAIWAAARSESREGSLSEGLLRNQ